MRGTVPFIYSVLVQQKNVTNLHLLAVLCYWQVSLVDFPKAVSAGLEELGWLSSPGLGGKAGKKSITNTSLLTAPLLG